MEQQNYIKTFVVFNPEGSFVEGFDTYQQVLAKNYPDGYEVYSLGCFIKHIKEFKKLTDVQKDKWDAMLNKVNMACYFLFC